MRQSKILRHLAVVVVIAAVTIAIAEAMSFAVLRYQQAPSSALAIFESPLVTGRHVMSVRKRANQRWSTTEFDILLKTNSEGYREDFDFNLADVEVAFMGDSFTFGHGVEASERFANLFAARMKGKIDAAHVVSLSPKNGFQPEHYEYFLKKNPDLRPKLIVIGLYLGNDLDADVRETRFDRQSLTLELPYRAVDRGVIVNATPYRVPFFRKLVDISNTARLIAILLNRSIYRLYLFEPNATIPNGSNSESLEFGKFNEYSDRAFQSLVNITEMARNWGGRVAVLVIPQNFYAGPVSNPHLAPDLRPRIPEILATGGLRAAVLNRCNTLKLECIDAGAVMTATDFFPADAHWSKDGHRKAADLLFQHFAGTSR